MKTGWPGNGACIRVETSGPPATHRVMQHWIILIFRRKISGITSLWSVSSLLLSIKAIMDKNGSFASRAKQKRWKSNYLPVRILALLPIFWAQACCFFLPHRGLPCWKIFLTTLPLLDWVSEQWYWISILCCLSFPCSLWPFIGSRAVYLPTRCLVLHFFVCRPLLLVLATDGLWIEP